MTALVKLLLLINLIGCSTTKPIPTQFLDPTENVSVPVGSVCQINGAAFKVEKPSQLMSARYIKDLIKARVERAIDSN